MTKQETADRNNFFRDCLIEELQNHGFDCEPSKQVPNGEVVK